MIRYPYAIRYKVQTAKGYEYRHSFGKCLRDAENYARGIQMKNAHVFDAEVYKLKKISWLDRMISHMFRRW